MEEQLISFPTAKLAKEKGFNWDTVILYNPKGELDSLNSEYYWGMPLNNNASSDFSAPTQSHLQKWLREVHKIDVTPQMCIEYPLDKELRRKGYGGNVYLIDDDHNIQSYFGSSYEEALEIGLQEALKFV